MKVLFDIYKTRIFVAFLFVAYAYAAAYSDNPDNYRYYIRTRTMLNASGTSYLDKKDYVDGFGRTIETLLNAASPSGKDIVTFQEYDVLGRVTTAWLAVPTASAGGCFLSPSTFKSNSTSFYGDSAYSRTVYEASSLNRILEQYGPGAAWLTGGKSVKSSYQTNTASGTLACTWYKVQANNFLQKNGYYAANQLQITQTTDEDGHVSYTFTDKQGQKLLTRVMNSTANDTYYVYDDYGRLRYVLPPSAADTLKTLNGPWDPKSDPILKSYAYYYSYDGRGNCIGKKLPGCDSIAMVYDAGDRLVFSQDGNLRKNNLWTFNLYDTFGRLAVTGLGTSTNMSKFQSSYVKAIYTGTAAPLGGYTMPDSLNFTVNRLLSVNYYDQYGFRSIQTALSDVTKLNYTTQTGYDAEYGETAPAAKGLLTGSRTYQMDDSTKYNATAMYYDQRGRMVQSHASNHLGGMEDHFMKLTFTGKEILEKHQHSATGKTSHSEVHTYAYDKAERLDTTYYNLDNSPTAVTLSANTYDEVGRLKSKFQGGAVDTANYSYNVRSWLTQITGGRFSQTLTYNTAVGSLTPTTCTFNGNISATCSNAASGTTRGYQFTYDGLNQMTNAVYGEGSTLSTNPNRYTETVTYDKQGNIQTLKRYGKQDSGYGLIDDLNYGYLDINNNKGNQLTKVTDAVSGPLYVGAFHFIDGEKTVPIEYIYDANGNMVQDYNKKIAKIQYNALNLPDKLQFTYGNTTDYLYDAAGGKLSVTYTTANTNLLVPMGSIVPVQSGNILTTSRTDYCGNIIYEDGVLSKILTEEGYVTLSGSSAVFHYYLKDHEGNNRVVLNQNGTVEQVNNYYPFGGLYGDNTGGSVQPYMYNGKELDRMHGLDLFDYGARHYDAALGRWFSVDPLAETNYSISLYAYCSDDPVNRIDPTGLIDLKEVVVYPDYHASDYFGYQNLLNGAAQHSPSFEMKKSNIFGTKNLSIDFYASKIFHGNSNMTIVKDAFSNRILEAKCDYKNITMSLSTDKVISMGNKGLLIGEGPCGQVRVDASISISGKSVFGATLNFNETPALEVVNIVSQGVNNYIITSPLSNSANTSIIASLLILTLRLIAL